jgi:hypothetical protein
LVERTTENREVTGSTPVGATTQVAADQDFSGPPLRFFPAPLSVGRSWAICAAGGALALGPSRLAGDAAEGPIEHGAGVQRDALTGARVSLGDFETGVPEGRLHVRRARPSVEQDRAKVCRRSCIRRSGRSIASRIEAAINKRLFAMRRTETITGGKIVLPSGHTVGERELLKPLGDPKKKKTTDFYELVALQHGRLTRQGDRNPSATMAQINGVALSTARGWVAKARDRALLPPERRGRAG